MQFAQANEMKFQSWLDNLDYFVSACVSDPEDPIRKRAETLPPVDQWRLVELMGQSLGTHRFLLCHPGKDEDDYALDFTGTAWLDYVPTRRHPLLVAETKHGIKGLQVSHDPAAIEALFVDLFVEAHARAPRQIIPDLDATDDPLHGHQEGRFFHGYYDCYCYLPLYVFCGRHLLAAKLRPSNIDASAGSVEEVARIVGQIRTRWPKTRILLRADSGFAREALMAWCEQNRVDFVFGLASNARLVAEIEAELAQAEAEASSTGKPARRYRDFRYATLDSRSRRHRVIGKAEWTKGEANPRFIVTSLKKAETNGRLLYEKVYCARGDMENRIKECHGDLFADRTSTATLGANQLRLWLASFAYVLICAVRRVGLAHTQFAEATCSTIRLKLLKLAGLVRISAQRIKFALASACPYADEWRLAAARLA